MNAQTRVNASTQRATFDALLARLRRDGDAGLGYESLRRRLLQFFRLHAPAEASELADITLDRLAHKLGEGTQVDSVPLYTLGIARMVLHEAGARRTRWHAVETDPDLLPDPRDADTTETAEEIATAVAALTHCLDDAGHATRELALAYYAADGGERIATRQRLAAEQRISVNALRNRMLRVRNALERCVRARLANAGKP